MQVPTVNAPPTNAAADHAAALEAQKSKEAAIEKANTGVEHTATDASKGKPARYWNIQPTADGVCAYHGDTGEYFVGSMADFNKHLKGA